MAKTNLLESLKKLDSNNPNHWTADGLPKVETVRLMASDQSISREDITNAAPTFNKNTPLEAVDAETSTQQALKEGVQLTPVLGTSHNADSEKNLAKENEAENPSTETTADKVINPVPHDADSRPTFPQTLVVTAELPDADGVHSDDKEVVETSNQEDEKAKLNEADQLQADIENLEKHIEYAKQDVYDAQKRLQEVELERDSIVDKQTSLRTNIHSQTHTRMAYLDAQKAKRDQQAAEATGKKNSFKSPLDKSYERKTNRGTQRPQGRNS